MRLVGRYSHDHNLGGISAALERLVLEHCEQVLTREQLERLIGSRADTFLTPLQNIFNQFDITSPLRKAHFMAQMCHESVDFQYLEEIWPDPQLDEHGVAHSGNRWQLNYEGRSDLGNTQVGDGYRYRGRGIIQLTGRANYRTYGALTNVDLENRPELASRPDVACAVAGHYWNSRNLNARADNDDVKAITRAINGGFNGLEDRISKLELAKDVF